MADHSDDLDQLLDSALDDFQNLNLKYVQSNSSENCGPNEHESSSMPNEVQGLGMGLPDLKKKGKKRVTKDSHVFEALEKLREQTREAVKGLESMTSTKPVADDFENNAMMDDWVKQFEELAGDQDMESMVETMMQQLLSKEVLHEPMKEIGERYPKWLEEHQSTLSKDDFERYSNQYQLIKDLNKVYEAEPGNFNKIVDLMQSMQECGQPPNDIVRELTPDFDISNLGQLSPEMLDSQQNCCIM